MRRPSLIFISTMLLLPRLVALADDPPPYNDPAPKRHDRLARASEIDKRTREHYEIDFGFVKSDRPADWQHA